MNSYKVNPAIIRVNFEGCKSGWNQDIMLMSDLHVDHPGCKRSKLKKDLEYARATNSPIIIAGDLFDATGGRNDPRRNVSSIRKRLIVPDYYDAVLKEVVNFMSPYADLIAVVGYGNHEDSVVKFGGTSLVDRFVQEMNRIGGHALPGGYGGYIRFGFYQNRDVPDVSKLLYYHHGRGGTEAPVTRGMIETNRQSVWLDGVDVVLNGHNHQNYITKIPVQGVSNRDTLRTSTRAFIRTPGYLQAYTEDADWTSEYGILGNKGPTACGCVMMHMEWDRAADSDTKDVPLTFTERIE